MSHKPLIHSHSITAGEHVKIGQLALGLGIIRLELMTQNIFFFISNKNSLILKKRHPSTQGVYRGEQVKNENYKSQVNPK